MTIAFTAGQVLTANQLNLLSPTFILKNSTQTVTNSATPVNDNDFVFTLLANQSAQVLLYIQASQSGTGSPGIRVSWTTTGTAGFASRCTIGPCNSVANVTSPSQMQMQSQPLASTTQNVYALGTNTQGPFLIFETLLVGGGASGGTIQMQWAQGGATASTSTTVNQGSYAVLRYVS